MLASAASASLTASLGPLATAVDAADDAVDGVADTEMTLLDDAADDVVDDAANTKST